MQAIVESGERIRRFVWTSLAMVRLGLAFMLYALDRFLWDAKQEPANRSPALLNSAFAVLAGYLSDRDALFSGVAQALQEKTFTTEYKWIQGFLLMGEWRHDFSNQVLFLISTPDISKKGQNSSTLGPVWW